MPGSAAPPLDPMNVSRRDVLTALRQHPQSERLCARIAEVCSAAARAKEEAWLSGRTVSSEAASLTELSPEDADTEFGNVLGILDRGAQTPVEWCVLGAATAIHLVRSLASGAQDHSSPQSDGETAGDTPLLERTSLSDAALLDDAAWLAAHTGCDPWAFLSLDEEPQIQQLWPLVDQRRTRWSAPEQLALAVGMMEAGSKEALALKANWMEQAGQPTLLAVLEASSTSSWLDGNLRHVPSPTLLFIQTISGYLLLKSLFRITSHYLLWKRRRCRFRVSPRGLEIVSTTTLLGRPFRERRHLIPLSEITHITRQTRYAGTVIYVGLACLILGTFFGTGLIVDGLRAPGTSPSLLWVGLGLILGALCGDFAASHWSRVVGGKGELLIRRRGARRLNLTELESPTTHEVIERLSRLRAFAGAAFTTSGSAEASNV